MLHDLEQEAAQLLAIGTRERGDADDIGEQMEKLLASGLDGIVVNMIADGHEPDAVALAGETLTKAMSRQAA